MVRTLEGTKPVGYKWVFVRKRNDKNEVVRYKARLVSQGFSQKPGVMDAITFRYLISLTAIEKLEMHLMNVLMAYLYGSLERDIYLRIPEGFQMPEAS